MTEFSIRTTFEADVSGYYELSWEHEPGQNVSFRLPYTLSDGGSGLPEWLPYLISFDGGDTVGVDILKLLRDGIESETGKSVAVEDVRWPVGQSDPVNFSERVPPPENPDPGWG